MAEAQARESSVQESAADLTPAVDVCENDEGVYLAVNLPGAEKDTLEVAAEDNRLTISGRAEAPSPEGYRLIAKEFVAGQYRRVFSLPEALDPEKIRARIRNGVLEIAIPWREKAKASKIKIET